MAPSPQLGKTVLSGEHNPLPLAHWPTRPLTFQLLSNDAALVVGVMDDGGWGGRAEALLFQPPAMTLLSRQHPLLALPLIQIIPSLSEVHVQAPSILLVGAGTQPDAIAWQRGQEWSDRTGNLPQALVTHQRPALAPAQPGRPWTGNFLMGLVYECTNRNDTGVSLE